jgi:hypothetical protein
MVDERKSALPGGPGSVSPCHLQVDYDYAASCRTTLGIVVGILVLGLILAVTALGDWVKGYRAAALSAEMVGERVRRRKRKDS